MYFPGLIQLLDGLFESHRGVSMAPARIEVNQGDPRHLEQILARGCGGIGLFGLTILCKWVLSNRFI
jgi:hypothetical protein